MASREEENVEVTFYYMCVRHLFVVLSFRDYIHIRNTRTMSRALYFISIFPGKGQLQFNMRGGS